MFVGMRDVGLEQIRAGMAWHYKTYEHEQTTQDRLLYRDEEDSARAARLDLWKDAKLRLHGNGGAVHVRRKY